MNNKGAVWTSGPTLGAPESPAAESGSSGSGSGFGFKAEGGSVTTGSGGDLAVLLPQGVTSTAANSLTVQLDASVAGCYDAFTGLKLPYDISSSLSLTSPLVVTPVTTLLAAAVAAVTSGGDDSLSSGTVVERAYGMVGVKVTASAVAGGLVALRQADIDERRTGVRMVFADAALSSLVITGAAALAAFPAGTLPSCTTEAALVNAVYGSLAAHINTSASLAISLDGTSLLSDVVTAAAKDKCGASTATMSNKDVQALLTQGSLLYRMVQSSLLSNGSSSSSNGGSIIDDELAVLPLEALSTASRVSYVVQTQAPTVLKALSSNTMAVQDLTKVWAAHLADAPVDLAGMASEVGLGSLAPSAGTLRIRVRALGGLKQCQVQLQSPYLANSTNVTTDSRGFANASGVCAPMVTVPSGCMDSALSANNASVPMPPFKIYVHVCVRVWGVQLVFKPSPTSLGHLLAPAFPFIGNSPAGPVKALVPFNTTAVINPAAAIATAAFMHLRTNEAAAAGGNDERASHITAADYALPYTYFGVGLVGRKDALPANTSFVSQEWKAGSLLDQRAFLVNLRLLLVLNTSSEVVLGLQRPAGTPADEVQKDRVVSALVSQIAADMLSNKLMITERSYLEGLIMSVYKETRGSTTGGSRRALQQSEQVKKVLAITASVLSNCTKRLEGLDANCTAAAADGGGDGSDTLDAMSKQAANVTAMMLYAVVPDLRNLTTARSDAAIAAMEQNIVNSYMVDNPEIPAGIFIDTTEFSNKDGDALASIDNGNPTPALEAPSRSLIPPMAAAAGSPLSGQIAIAPDIAGGGSTREAGRGTLLPMSIALSATIGSVLVLAAAVFAVRHVKARNAFRFKLDENAFRLALDDGSPPPLARLSSPCMSGCSKDGRRGSLASSELKAHSNFSNTNDPEAASSSPPEAAAPPPPLPLAVTASASAPGLLYDSEMSPRRHHEHHHGHQEFLVQTQEPQQEWQRLVQTREPHGSGSPVGLLLPPPEPQLLNRQQQQQQQQVEVQSIRDLKSASTARGPGPDADDSKETPVELNSNDKYPSYHSGSSSNNSTMPYGSPPRASSSGTGSADQPQAYAESARGGPKCTAVTMGCTEITPAAAGPEEEAAADNHFDGRAGTGGNPMQRVNGGGGDGAYPAARSADSIPIAAAGQSAELPSEALAAVLAALRAVRTLGSSMDGNHEGAAGLDPRSGSGSGPSSKALHSSRSMVKSRSTTADPSPWPTPPGQVTSPAEDAPLQRPSMDAVPSPPPPPPLPGSGFP
ncbi:hypothetical protein VOLCADRAFT_89973 [Volvox carteri f. nagariensis]|uniref:Uncharacterized protein n=1 Tax=Volvox carteri f. nagariensis TaxID=3068 RepID=D8TT55_VOLCA|nr:uncharacterized protein VOLCADRAFT_89973 [Volvox carteri f. nagariensis]EFJ49135.1 hypothetical protein VOLCADRAFT_89973 [Volvox carteri f. nagariensis]|eukprot:XP_002949583.1 hypothetical protein VOLCADRAFT_89973 [Volvox carteri f. nagariensis]